MFGALVIGAVVVVAVNRSDDDSSEPTTEATSEPSTALLLEPAGTAGPDAFTVSVATREIAIPTEAAFASTPQRPTGNEPGLYGGTQNESACDPAALVAFLEQNPDKAAAWASALDITPASIREYVAQLTPVVLRTDTRVTNHGFVDGRAAPRQSVLQAGTAVLVDAYGVPRVRCSCGNPLTEPSSLATPLPTALESGEVVLAGQPWGGWNPAIVVVIQTSASLLDQFILWDLISGGEYVVLIGGAPPTTTTVPPTTVTPTTQPPTTTTIAPENLCGDAPPGDPTDGYGSGDVGCNPETGERVCYIGPDIVPCN